MAIILDQHYQISAEGIEIVSVDCTPQLTDSKTLTGTPTIEIEEGDADNLTLGTPAINSATFTDPNQTPDATIAISHAVLFLATPAAAGTWRLRLTVNTNDTTPAARKLVYDFYLTAT